VLSVNDASKGGHPGTPTHSTPSTYRHFSAPSARYQKHKVGAYGKVDSDNVEIRYSLRPMTSL